jgi:hypothetical protein
LDTVSPLLFLPNRYYNLRMCLKLSRFCFRVIPLLRFTLTLIPYRPRITTNALIDRSKVWNSKRMPRSGRIWKKSFRKSSMFSQNCDRVGKQEAKKTASALDDIVRNNRKKGVLKRSCSERRIISQRVILANKLSLPLQGCCFV